MSLANVLELFLKNTELFPNQPCLRYKTKKQQWKDISWLEVKEMVFKLAAALEKMGIGAGDKVAILSNTRYEWTIIDLAVLTLNAVTVPIYQSTLADEVKWILEHSEAKVLFLENSSQIKKLETIKSSLQFLKQTVVIERASDDYPSFKKIIDESALDLSFKDRISKIDLKSLATIVYTSGTTGQPKGVMLSHLNLAAAIHGLQEAFPLPTSIDSLFFLPLAHILAREVQYFQLAQGFVHIYAESIDKLIDNIREVRPHYMVCVPRIFEKIYSKILHDVEKGGLFKKMVFDWAVSVGRVASRSQQQGKGVSTLTSLQQHLARRLVFSKLHEKLGGRIRFFISGGAPLSKDIAEFFHAADILILEGYGLTETVAGTIINFMDSYRFGTVGHPLKGVELKTAEDGEILVRGDQVFKGYYKDEKATSQVFTPDGFFQTGDIGEISPDGFLKITDRKKDLIITSAGKNVAPQYLENMLKTDPFISQVMACGDQRKYITALITLNADALHSLAKELEISSTDYATIAKNPKVFEFMKKRIDEKNKHLPSYETIKRFAILDQDWTVEGGELTPSLKVKRKVLTERYKDVIEKMYQEG